MNVFVKAQKQVGTKCLPQTHSSLSSAALPSCRPFSAGFTQSAQQSKQLRHQYNQELLGHPQVRYIALHTINCIVFCVLPWVGFFFLGFARLEVYVLAATTTAALQHIFLPLQQLAPSASHNDTLGLMLLTTSHRRSHLLFPLCSWWCCWSTLLLCICFAHVCFQEFRVAFTTLVVQPELLLF